jgi:glycosyltransferase involved in cell wall biosynthesis
LPREFAGRNFIAFIGTMNYFPNIEGACWFANQIFPELRRQNPGLEFLVIGKRPVREVKRLGTIDGVTITGGVEDIRPFITGARALVAPLRIARGIQNKVLEGLAMGRKVYVTAAVARTFGGNAPNGLVECATEHQFIHELLMAMNRTPQCDPDIRRAARERFSWGRNLEVMTNELEWMIRAGEHQGAPIEEKIYE